MSSKKSDSNYDYFAQEYNEVYAQILSEQTIQILEKLLLVHLPKAANILDLCCGTGQLAQKLLIKGYQITGLDRSESMLNYARSNATEGKFILCDAQSFELPPIFDAVISMYALNYVMNLEELMSVFRNVNTALKTNGIFIFNLRLEEDFKSYWDNSTTRVVRDDYAWISQKSYNSEEKIGQIQITGFQLIEKEWKPLEQIILEKTYSRAEVLSALEKVGFRQVSVHEEKHDAVFQERSEYTYFVSYK
ncbi:MAG: class I SAM-dependent DNA methyltransferase [Nostoc sp. ChiSLP01]|nr:methyltransferase domain-containing protein [Nostoc sp. CmiSLP01]MDZ8288660.1 methyltransferase domain-containing protein [Nostoc sp. ChiSLP01]